jgi:hypothetical protein
MKQVETNPSKSMRPSRLNEIIQAAEENKATLNDVVEIAAGTLASSSRNSLEIKDILKSISDRLGEIEEKIDFLYQHNSPIYAAAFEDDEDIEDDEEDENDEEE